ncbi:MAG: amidohydrolase family protein [Limisphaerales bacterium]
MTAAPAPLPRRRWPRLLALLALTLSLGGCVACRVFYSGPYRTPEPLPTAKLLDMHIHTAGIGAGESGCFISEAMAHSWKLGTYLKAFGTTREEVQQKGDAFVVQLISRQLGGSKHVGQAILLAMDGLVDEKGELDKLRTEIYVPNEFVAKETAKTTNLLFGASINPLRHDALARLDWAATNGARLVKWIPSVMQFDPSDERITPFYRRLVELKLPLLTHAGQERSFTNARDELCDPQRLHLPLKLGVTVIVAHIASTGANAGQRDTDRLAPMMATYTNLFSEISSLTQVNKLGYLKEALTRPEWQGRLLFGSDYPLINTPLCSPHFYPLQLTGEERSRIAEIANPWDRDVELKQALGVPREVFTRSRELFR